MSQIQQRKQESKQASTMRASNGSTPQKQGSRRDWCIMTKVRSIRGLQTWCLGWWS